MLASSASGLTESIVIGVTSHRNLVPHESGEIRRRVHDFLERLRRDFPQLPLTVVSALAAGGDQLVAEEALALGARLIAPLPLPRAVYVRDFADPRSRERFDTLAALMGIAFVFCDELSQPYMIFVFLFLFAIGVTLDQIAPRRPVDDRRLGVRARQFPSEAGRRSRLDPQCDAFGRPRRGGGRVSAQR